METKNRDNYSDSAADGLSTIIPIETQGSPFQKHFFKCFWKEMLHRMRTDDHNISVGILVIVDLSMIIPGTTYLYFLELMSSSSRQIEEEKLFTLF